ncbi:MAG: DEAD/DEAH box helicase [Planctomycetota bacterium]
MLDAVLGEALEHDWTLELTGLHALVPDEVRVDARETADAIVLDGYARYGARKLSLEQLLAGRESGRIELADGTVALVPGSLRRALAWAERLGDRRGGSVHLDARRGWLAAPLLAGLGVALPESAVRARAAFDPESADDVEPPRSFVGELRPYQRASLSWFERLERLGLGGCLADDMGLGKTVQVLARLVARAGSGTAQGPSLVVAPRSVLHHWEQQAARFAPTLSVATHSGPTRDLAAAREADLVLVTYGTLRQDAGAFAREPWDLVVLDESQAIKNASSRTAEAARGLLARARLALSGTPVENHLGELASLMAFLNPGLLGASGTALEKLRDERTAKELLGALAPVFLRRTKSEVLEDLPPRTETTIVVDLEGEQRERYEALRLRAREELLGERDGAERGATMNVLAHLTRLRQAACHVALVDPSLAEVASAKFDALLPRLEELADEGRKALVFSQFASLLRLLPRELEARGLGWELLDGETRNREARVARFESDPTVTVFLVSLKAGGTGLDLTAADTVFLLDPWWNPAAERQAVDRAHRIGQKKPVFAYRFVAKGTVEERVAELASSKGALLEDLFASERLGRIDRETLAGLL